MDLGLKGRVAVVGGASRGLGYAFARRLAEEGASVAICSRRGEAIDEAAARIRHETGAEVLSISADQTTAVGVDRILAATRDRFGGIDILVNNTGGPPPGLFADHGDEAWQAAFEGNLLSVVRLCRGVLPEMTARGWGRIVTNTSFTVKEPAERLVLSNALRAAVVALSKTLSREVASRGVTVHCVCPGAFDTERLRRLFEEQAKAQERRVDEVEGDWVDRIPIGRILRPEELADLVAYLASERAGGMTGTCIAVDGGMLHGLF